MYSLELRGEGAVVLVVAQGVERLVDSPVFFGDVG